MDWGCAGRKLKPCCHSRQSTAGRAQYQWQKQTGSKALMHKTWAWESSHNWDNYLFFFFLKERGIRCISKTSKLVSSEPHNNFIHPSRSCHYLSSVNINETKTTVFFPFAVQSETVMGRRVEPELSLPHSVNLSCKTPRGKTTWRITEEWASRITIFSERRRR